MYEEDWESDNFDDGDSWSEDVDDADDYADTISCQNCGRDVYDDAPQCPYCGEYIVHDSGVWSNKSPATRMFYKLVAIVLILAFLGTGLTLVVQLLKWLTG